MRTLFTLMLLLLSLPDIAVGQVVKVVQITDPDGKQRHVLLSEMTISPQKLPTPALKYNLVWGFDQQLDGNAAPKYIEAFRQHLYAIRNFQGGLTQQLEKDFDRLLTDTKYFSERKKERDAFEKELAAIPDDPEPDPVTGERPKSAERRREEKTINYLTYEYSHYCGWRRDKFPMDKAKEFVMRFRPAYDRLKEASRYEYCNYNYHIRGNRNVIGILLPEIQDARDLARALQVKARVEIYEKRFADAVETIRVGKALARHVAETPILVSGLVGIAIEGIMDSCLIEMLQEPDAPNLYWALTSQPAEPFSFAKSIRMEMDFLRLMVPLIAKAMDEPENMTDADWQTLADDCMKTIREIQGSDPSMQYREAGFKLLQVGAALMAYPKAKQFLLEQGKTEEEIDKMPVAKVIGLYGVYKFAVIRDSYLKAAELPFWQTENIHRSIEDYESEMQRGRASLTPPEILANYLMPATRAAQMAYTRTICTNDALRIVEAIRLHAAENDGKFPQSLDEIQSVPIPRIDPSTGKAYSYRVEDGAAIIDFCTGYSASRFVVRLR